MVQPRRQPRRWTMRTFTVRGWVVIAILLLVVAVCGVVLFGCKLETRGETMQRKAAEARELEVRKQGAESARLAEPHLVGAGECKTVTCILESFREGES
jgi:hypothetical protein